MDKENLYYIVEKGTNARIFNMDKTTWIGMKEIAERRIESWKTDDVNYEIISIKEYENKFV